MSLFPESGSFTLDANEVLRWPLFDPVTIDASAAGISVRRSGVGARLLGVASIPVTDWAACRADRDAEGGASVRVTLGEHTVLLHGVGGQRVLGLLHASGQAGPNRACPSVVAASPGILGRFGSWVAVGPGGVALLEPSALGLPRTRCIALEDILGAEVDEDDLVRLTVAGAASASFGNQPGLLSLLARLLVRRPAPWHPGELPEGPFPVEIERPVVWFTDQLRLRVAWLRAGASGLELFGADGSSLQAPAAALRRVDDGETGEDSVTMRVQEGVHSLIGCPGDGLATALWPRLQDQMYWSLDEEAIGAGWRRASGEFARFRLESELGLGWEIGPVAAAVLDGCIVVIVPESAPWESGSTVRASLVRGRTRVRFTAQVAGRQDPAALPRRLAGRLERLGVEGEALVLHPLQPEPINASQRRGLVRLNVETREVRVSLTAGDVEVACGTVVDVSGLGVCVLLDDPCQADLGGIGRLHGLSTLLGEQVDPITVRLVHSFVGRESRVLLGLRFEGLPPARIDELHACVLAMERTRALVR